MPIQYGKELSWTQPFSLYFILTLCYHVYEICWDIEMYVSVCRQISEIFWNFPSPLKHKALKITSSFSVGRIARCCARDSLPQSTWTLNSLLGHRVATSCFCQTSCLLCLPFSFSICSSVRQLVWKLDQNSCFLACEVSQLWWRQHGSPSPANGVSLGSCAFIGYYLSSQFCFKRAHLPGELSHKKWHVPAQATGIGTHISSVWGSEDCWEGK